MIQKVLIVIGGLAILIGAVWMGQGAGIIPGSFMSGDKTWLGIGLAVAAVGLVLVYVGLQRPRPKWAARRPAQRPPPSRLRRKRSRKPNSRDLDPMIALARFEVPLEEVPDFRQQAEAAIAVLAARSGFVSADLGRNLDDPRWWTITTRWQNVGSYRRALQGFESKLVVAPLLSRAFDEPSAYEHPDLI